MANVDHQKKANLKDLHDFTQHLLPLTGPRYICKCPEDKCKCPGKVFHAKLSKQQRKADKWIHHPDSYHHKPVTVAELEQWPEIDPYVNAAIMTGKDFDVVDIDDGPPPACLELLQSTVTALTGKGYHYYYEPSGCRGTDKIWAKCNGASLQLKAAGGYVVAPGSTHPNGNKYRWAPGKGPKDLPVAPFPPELLEVFANAKNGQKRPNTDTERTTNVEEATSKDILACGLSSSEDNSSSSSTGNLVVDELSKDYQATCAILKICGIDAPPLGKAFTSPMPGKPDNNPSAVLLRRKNGRIWLRDYGGGRCGGSIAIPEIYYLHVTGEYRRLTKGEKTVWHIRAAIDAGLIDPPEVQKPELPADAWPEVSKVLEGFILRDQVRRVLGDAEGFTFSWKFATAWCGAYSSFRPVERVMTYLLKNEVIHTTGETVGCFGKLTNLWGLGPHQRTARECRQQAELQRARAATREKAEDQAVEDRQVPVAPAVVHQVPPAVEPAPALTRPAPAPRQKAYQPPSAGITDVREGGGPSSVGECLPACLRTWATDTQAPDNKAPPAQRDPEDFEVKRQRYLASLAS